MGMVVWQLPNKTLSLDNMLEEYDFDLLKKFLQEKAKKLRSGLYQVWFREMGSHQI